MGQRAVLALKAMLAVLIMGGVAAQVSGLPGLAAEYAAADDESAWLQVPLLAVAILVIACAQVAFLATWALLSMIGEDRIFEERAFVFVDAILAAILAATALVAVAVVFVVTARLDGAIVIILSASVAVGVALALLVLVLRGLLRKATLLQHDLAEVV